MNLFARRRDLTTPPASVPEADVRLLQIREGYAQACASAVTAVDGNRRAVTFATVKWWHGRLDELLERRLELDRAERAGQIETWWWGPVPQWPLGQSEVGA